MFFSTNKLLYLGGSAVLFLALPITSLGASPSAINIFAPPTSSKIAQAPTAPFPLDGKVVYVSRKGSWQEARLTRYSWRPSTGFLYNVTYLNDNRTEQNIPVSRIITAAEAQKRGLTKKTYNVSTPTGVQEMVTAHNEWRKRYGVGAVSWSPQLATYAQEWANTLIRENRFEHRPNNKYGENIAYARGQQLGPTAVVNMWGSEVKDYNYATNICRSGAICGHYTQVVWRNTTQIGCAMAKAGDREVWVCNYNPPGNYDGEKPY